VPAIDVFDGSTAAGVDLDLRYSPTVAGLGVLEASWTDDPGADGFEVAIGSSPGADDAMAWTDVGATLDGTFGGLDLEGAWEGFTYFVSVRSYAGAWTCPEWASDGVQIAEAEVWTGDVTELRPPDAWGGYTVDWPQAGYDAVYGEHWVEEVDIADGTTVHVQGWGRVDGVVEGIAPTDGAVTEPADGWLTLWAEDITIAGTITASGRGYGGGGSGGGTCGGTATRGRGGVGGLAGGGGAVAHNGCSGAAGGGGGSPGGPGGSGYSVNTNGGDGDMWGAGGGGSGQWGGGNANTKGGHSGMGAGGGAAGGVSDIGMTGASREINSSAPGGAGEFTVGGGGGGSWHATGASGGGGGGGGYGAGGGGGNESYGTGAGGGGSGGQGGGNGGNGLAGSGPWGGAGGAEVSSVNGIPGIDGGYAGPATNDDVSDDDSLQLGSGGGGGGASQSQSAGGGGAAGGGYIKLRAMNTVEVTATGRLLANGAGGGGGAGDDNTNRIGGAGGSGAGGGLLLEANELIIDATGSALSCRGGDDQLGNGGTIKLFYGTFTGTPLDSSWFGRVLDAGPSSYP
jgi:hypothetical protein